MPSLRTALAILGFVVTATVAAPAADEPESAKHRAMQKNQDLILRVGAKVVSGTLPLDIYRLGPAEGDWTWVESETGKVKGWARTEDLITLDDAIAFFSGEIHADPEDPLPHVKRAKAHEALGRPEQAKRDYDEAVRLDPTHAWAYNWRGIFHRSRKEFDAAIADHTRAMAAEPGREPSYLDRALCYLDLNRFDDAIADLEACLKLNPNDAGAYDRLGWAYESEGQHDRAIEFYGKAIELRPDVAETYVNRGLAWFAKANYDRSIADMTEALHLTPDDPFALNARGWALTAKREYGPAIRDFDRSIRLDPRFARAYTNRGIARVASKDFDGALADFNRSIALASGRPRPYLNRARVYLVKGEATRARSDLDRAIELAPKDPWLRYNRLVATLLTDPTAACDGAATLLAEAGTREELAVYTALLGHHAASRAGRRVDAQRFLDDADRLARGRPWQAQLVDYLKGRIDGPRLLSAATDPAQQTQAHLIIGLKKSVSAHPEEALVDLRWVRDHGLSTDALYPLAVQVSNRMGVAEAQARPTRPEA